MAGRRQSSSSARRSVASDSGGALFNLEFLHVIREYELARIVPYLRPGARVLEIGGGTGYQAKRLKEAGFDVASIDIAGCGYGGTREFPIVDYDGSRVPFPDGSFDIVFSSNVLEHVPDLAQLQREMLRVLRRGGYCIHVMPTGSWRFWTNVAHYVELGQRIVLQMPQLLPRSIRRREVIRLVHSVAYIGRLIRQYLIVPRHGEHGNALSEVVTFGERYWRRRFVALGFDVNESVPLGLFYTGHMVLGKRLSIAARTRLARTLGSACIIYKVTPTATKVAQQPHDAAQESPAPSLRQFSERRSK
jgi:SAM-dependent methyltransferase